MRYNPCQNQNLEQSFGRVPESEIPSIFKEENDLSDKEMYNVIKKYMVAKYGKGILDNYKWCPEIDQLQSYLTANNKETKRIASILARF